jgi:predicted secreted protein
MTTLATIGFGALFQILNTAVSPDLYTAVGEVTNITMPNLSRDAVDATHTESTGAWREFIPGLKDAGEVTIEGNYIHESASDTLIRAQFASNALTTFRIVFEDSPVSGIQFTGIVTGYEVAVPLDDKKAFTLTVKVSGVVTVL